MIRLSETIQVSRSVSDCFRYLVDFSAIEQWDPGVYRAAKRTPGAPRVGSEFDLLLNSAGRRIPMRYVLQELVPNERLVLEGVASTLRARDTITLHAQGDARTEIHYVAELTFQGGFSRGEPLLRPWLNRVGRAAVSGMQAALEIPQMPEGETVFEKLKERLILPGAWEFSERGYLHQERKAHSEWMDGKTVVITGPTSGLGLAAACELSRLGATLVLLGRNRSRLDSAVRQIRDFSGAEAERISVYEGELSLKRDLYRLGREVRESHPKIDGLIHNAGALFDRREETSEGVEKGFAIHLLAPWVLTRELLPALKAARGRVILVSSGGMYTQRLPLEDFEFRQRPYQGARAYATLKRGQVVLAEHWGAEFSKNDSGVEVFAMHPGWAATPGVARALPQFDRLLQGKLRDSRMGADTIVWLVSAQAVRGLSGRFWFDRKARPTSLLPGTASGQRETEALLRYLEASGSQDP